MATGGCRTQVPAARPTATWIAPNPNTPAAIAAATTGGGRPQIAIDTAAEGKLTVQTANAKVDSAPATITALAATETQALHARMEPLPDLTAQNAQAPTLHAPTPAPDRPGPVTPIAFVVPAGKAVSDAPLSPGVARPAGPLASPTILPQGEVRAESEIRVRFDEAMVPIAAVNASAKAPATITPAVAGTWRWIDTRVVVFAASARRLPAATDFLVTVPAGTKALSGAVLAADVTAKFSTPPPAITSGYPTATLRPDSAIVVELDQDIDADRLLKLLRVTRAKSNQPLAYRRTSLGDARRTWVKNPMVVKDLARTDALPAQRIVVLAPATTWPAGSEIQVTLKPGAPSREGPRVSTRESVTDFQIAAPFTVEGIQCWGVELARRTGATCPAKSNFNVAFSNPIAEASYRAQKVQIDGMPFEDNSPSGETVSLTVPDPAGRTYTVSVGDGIVDVYDQPLVGPRKLAFATGPERFEPALRADTGVQVLDPRWQIPQWVVTAQALTSVHVQLYQVQPKDYFAFVQYEQGKRAAPPGKRVLDKTYEVGPQHGVTARVDLRPALANGLGHVIAIATAPPPATPSRWNPIERQLAWLQVTKLGVSARFDGEAVNAWVQDITPTDRFLAPIAGATTSLVTPDRGESAIATTEASGHARIELFPAPAQPRADDREESALLVTRTATDSTFEAISQRDKAVRRNDALWYVTDDRFIYKPGEKVYVKGWVRWTHNGVNPDLQYPNANDTVSYSISDSRGSRIGNGTLKFTDQGGFDVTVDIPKTANLGTAYFTFATRGDGYRHPIEIQEFRTPAYSVSLNDDVSHSGALPVILGESIDMTASAKYYAGGGLAGAGIQWKATLTTTHYDPPGWHLFSFEPPSPRSDHTYYQYQYRYRHDDRSVSADQAGSLSGASAATVSYGIAALPSGRPSILAVDATVTDVDRMSIRASSRPILVHPSTYYVGLRLRPGTVNTLEAIVTDVDGNAVKDVAIAIEIEGVLGSERFRRDAIVTDTQSCKLTSAATPVECAFVRRDDKTAYTARARIADARGRTNVAELDVPWWSFDDTKDLSIVPDKASYRPGDVAKLDIRSTIVPATAVVTFARQGVIAQKRVELVKPSTLVELPIEVAYVQNVHVTVDRYAKRRAMQKGSTLPIPEATQAEIDVPVDVEAVRLAMRTRATRKLVEPGEEATFEVDVKRDGKPVAGAEVALIVVDEAVLALAAKSHADPLAPFYHKVAGGTSATSTLSLVTDSGDELDGIPGVERFKLEGGVGWGTIGHGYGGGGSGYGVGGGIGSLRGAVVESRKDFRANAVFSPTLHTDGNGRVSLTVKMPDSLTRFRIVALAAYDGHYFGKAENTIVTQRKVNARTVAPRFLTQGDRFSLPIVVQNLDSAPRTVTVAVRAANLDAVGPAGKRVVVPGGQRAEVRFDFTTRARGRAVIQTIATSGDFADASNVELPIYEPATTESFATYGTVDDAPKFEQLAVPASIFKDVGGVEVELASTQLQSITDAYWYLYRYPYECAEQRSGRMLATAALYDILDAFSAPGRPSKQDIDAQRAKDAVILGKEQRADGGWGYFMGIKSDPFVTQQVLQALAAQKIAGKVTTAAIGYVTKDANAMLAKLEKEAAQPVKDRRERAQHPYLVSLAAASLSSLGAAGVDVRARAERLHALATTLDAYPVDAKARVLAIVAKLPRAQAMRAQLLRELISAAHETASSATVTAQYVESERLLLVSSTKTTALALDAIMREAPDHALVTKLARGVLDGRHHGRWRSTQENLVALQTMRHYFDTYEKVTPSYTGKLWFGTAAYAEQAFVGRSSARATARADWSALAPGSTHDLAIVKQGAGRMYYRVGITYAPKQTDLPALDAGFIVRRAYTAVDDPADVTKTPTGYKIRLGAKVQVTLETVTTTKRYAVALVDPLPAGFETVNTALATAERAAAAPLDSHWDHINMRDDRSEAFRMDLPEGTHHFSYTVRATTPGTFIAAPTKAEEMYSPETFGRSSGLTVAIE